jgi:hypothetical protein
MRIAGRILLALAVVVSCIAARGYSAFSDIDTFHSSSATKVFKHPVSAQWTGARLKVDMRVERGAADVRLIDGRGTTRWESTVSSGPLTVDRTFDGTGTWRIVVKFHNATGRYRIRLIAV